MKKVAVGLLVLLIGAGLAGATDISFEQQRMGQIAQVEQCQPTEKNYVVTVTGRNGETEEITVVATSAAEAEKKAERAYTNRKGHRGKASGSMVIQN